MRRDHRPAVLLSCAANFMIVLDTTAVNVALPSLNRELSTGIAGLTWVVDAYTLTFGAFLLLGGSVSDRLGGRTCFGVGMTLFALSSCACGFAGSTGVLVVARAFQGAGAALMLPASLALVAHGDVAPEIRARAVGLWAASGGAGVAAGPVVGGMLTQELGWRSVFFINAVPAVAALCMLARIAPSPRQLIRPDLFGNLLAATALAALTFALIQGGDHGFTTMPILVAAGVACLLAVGFVLVERRVPSPALPLHVFANRAAIATIFAGATIYFSFYGLVFTLSLLMQQEFNYSPVSTGLMFLPLSLVVVISTLQTTRWARRHPPWVPLSLGIAIMAIGLAILVPLSARPTPWLIVLGTTTFGAGSGIAGPTILLCLMPLLPASRSGMASAFVAALRQVAATVGVAIFGALLTTNGNLSDGARSALLVGLVVVLLGLGAAWAGVRKPPSDVQPAAESPTPLPSAQ